MYQGENEYGQTFDDNWNIEEYLKHLYEMPSGWPSEALKSQAIAARSYALSYTNNGSGSICPSQQCQVVKRSRIANPGRRLFGILQALFLLVEALL